ncbi:hypothetical protein COL154_010399 [Colletotrichum chrysophilum]|nr:hypothetical protein KNSL1_009432 [Colletotrichum chrysophilum]KAJ0357197.1 hypothetical protein COL154_010399 [Colletotrichum chrysophilum]
MTAASTCSPHEVNGPSTGFRLSTVSPVLAQNRSTIGAIQNHSSTTGPGTISPASSTLNPPTCFHRDFSLSSARYPTSCSTTLLLTSSPIPQNTLSALHPRTLSSKLNSHPSTFSHPLSHRTTAGTGTLVFSLTQRIIAISFSVLMRGRWSPDTRSTSVTLPSSFGLAGASAGAAEAGKWSR